MDWIELTVATTSEGTELVSEQLIEAGSAGTMIVDRRDVDEYSRSRPEGRWDILDDKILTGMPEGAHVTGYYAKDFRAMDVVSDVRQRMDALRRRSPEIEWGALSIATNTLDDEDWAENWKKSFVPFRLGERMLVKPGWCDVNPEPGDRVIEIDPGMAFGTGTHETTGLCVVLLEKTVKPGDKVIDLGTGTGILAIAAALCGAGDVLATDIDPVAVRVATDNIRINGLEGSIRIRQGDLLEAVDEVADVLVANIIADVICMIAQGVRAHIRPGGAFICSGIAKERKQGVLDALRAAQYQDIEVFEQGEWAAMRARNPA